MSDNPNQGTIATVAGTTQPTAGEMLKDGQCAKQDVSTMKVVPTIWLVLDGSGSMVTPLSSTSTDMTSRWVAMRTALMDPTAGVVKSLEHVVKWGMVMFDGPLPAGTVIALPDGGAAMFSSGPATTCPRLVTVEAAKDNFMAIDMAFPPDPLGGSTPTDKALQAVIQHLPTATTMGPDQTSSPTIVVLATDGAPNNFCTDSLFPPDVQPAVVAAVQQLAAAGNKTYVISLAGDDTQLMQDLTMVAQAGGTGMPPFVPQSKDELIKTFQNIVGPGVACDIKLAGKVKMGSECRGTLEVNGMPLTCDDDNGWRLKDPSTISITGTACDAYKMDDQAVLHADFPCDVIALN
jgi:hypothetical protein